MNKTEVSFTDFDELLHCLRLANKALLGKQTMQRAATGYPIDIHNGYKVRSTSFKTYIVPSLTEFRLLHSLLVNSPNKLLM